MSVGSGDRIVSVNIAATVIFAITAAYAAVVFTTAAQWVGAVTVMVLFSIGVVAFIWSYWTVVQRSRTEQISVAELYLLMGGAVPTRVRRTMNLVLCAQFAIALATALGRPNGPDGNPGSSLVVGFLVPMLGFGLNGLWASKYAKFDPRADPAPETRTTDDEIRQNAEHG